MPTPRTRGHKVPTEGTDIETAPQNATPETKVDTYTLHNKAGEIIYKSDVPKGEFFYRTEREQEFAKHLRNILKAAINDGVDPRDIHLEGMNLAGVDLQLLTLPGITLTGCQLQRADLRHADLEGANLSGCTFGGARLHGADLRNANIDDTDLSDVEAGWIQGLIWLGDLDGWKVYGYKDSEGILRIRAGCRNFTLPEAREHWEERDDRKEIYASLTLLEVVARNRGWRVTDVGPQPDNANSTAQVAKADEEDFEDDDE